MRNDWKPVEELSSLRSAESADQDVELSEITLFRSVWLVLAKMEFPLANNVLGFVINEISLSFKKAMVDV